MVDKVRKLWTHRPWAVIGLAVAAAGSAGFTVVRLARPSVSNIPTAEVKRGEFVDTVQIRGEVKALKTMALTAPSTAGDVQIIRIVRTGTRVKKGDVVVRFDTANLRRTLDQKRSELKQAEAEIEKARAQARLQEEQDRTDLMKARYDVERARLEASKQEILSKIEGEKTKLSLADAEQKLRAAEEKDKSDRASAAAEIKNRQQKRDKFHFEVRQGERDIADMTLHARIEGMVTLLQNWRAGGFFSGNAPEFKEGDRAWPGAGIAELPDLSSLRIVARVDETERGRLTSGQTATIRVDAVPDKELPGRVARVSTLAEADFAAGWPFPRNFELDVQLDRAEPRLRPGMSGTVRVAVERIPDSLVIPAEGAFPKDGKTVAYVLHRWRFEERVIEVGRRSSEQVLVTNGLRPGERIALKVPSALEPSGQE